MTLDIAPSAAASALTGIRAASRRLDRAASTLVSASVPEDDTVSMSAQGRQAAALAATLPTGSSSDAGNVAGALVDMRVAKYQNAASIAVLHASDDMTTDLVRLVDPKDR